MPYSWRGNCKSDITMVEVYPLVGAMTEGREMNY